MHEVVRLRAPENFREFIANKLLWAEKNVVTESPEERIAWLMGRPRQKTVDNDAAADRIIQPKDMEQAHQMLAELWTLFTDYAQKAERVNWVLQSSTDAILDTWRRSEPTLRDIDLMILTTYSTSAFQPEPTQGKLTTAGFKIQGGTRPPSPLLGKRDHSIQATLQLTETGGLETTTRPHQPRKKQKHTKKASGQTQLLLGGSTVRSNSETNNTKVNSANRGSNSSAGKPRSTTIETDQLNARPGSRGTHISDDTAPGDPHDPKEMKSSITHWGVRSSSGPKSSKEFLSLIIPSPKVTKKAWNRWEKKGPNSKRKRIIPQKAPRSDEGLISGQTRLAFDLTRTNNDTQPSASIHLINETRARAARDRVAKQNSARSERLAARRSTEQRQPKRARPDEEDWNDFMNGEEGKTEIQEGLEGNQLPEEPVAIPRRKRRRDIRRDQIDLEELTTPSTQKSNNSSKKTRIENQGGEPRDTEVDELNKGLVPKGIG
jgi:hypothetical protein